MILQEAGYYVCYDGGPTIQYFDLSEGGKLYNGLEFHEMFNTFEEAKARVNELADDDDYFDTHCVAPEPAKQPKQ
jgi:hypothetical protein